MLQTHNNEPIHNSENKIQKPNVKLPDNIDPFVHSTDRKVNHLECKAVAPFGHIEPLFWETEVNNKSVGMFKRIWIRRSIIQTKRRIQLDYN